MKKNVLFITRKWPPAIGGMETYCVELARALEPHVNLTLIAQPGRKNGAPPRGVALVGFAFRVLFHLMRRRQSYDVIHGADMAIWPLIYIASLRLKTTVTVLSAHGTDVALASRKGGIAFLYRRYLRCGGRLLKNSVILANSSATAALLRSHGFFNIQTVRLGASPACSKSEKSNSKYVLFVGRLIKSKGCSWFIKKILPHLPSEIRLKVIGTVVDGEEGASLANHRVDYLGAIRGEELDRLRREALVVVAPNIMTDTIDGFEGFGLTATEASAAGAIVLAANAYGLTDAVIENETGFLLPAEKPAPWIDKIIAVSQWTQEERTRFTERSVEMTRSYFSWARVGDETLAAYNQSKAPA